MRTLARGTLRRLGGHGFDPHRFHIFFINIILTFVLAQITTFFALFEHFCRKFKTCHLLHSGVVSRERALVKSSWWALYHYKIYFTVWRLIFWSIFKYLPGSNLSIGKLLGHQKHGIIHKIGEGTTTSLFKSLYTLLFLDAFLSAPHEEIPFTSSWWSNLFIKYYIFLKFIEIFRSKLVHRRCLNMYILVYNHRRLIQCQVLHINNGIHLHIMREF